MRINRIKNVTLINTITSIILQIITILNGFIIPKLILIYFGSEVNGLTSSITQFLGYIYLVEGGITGVLMSRLYKPLYENDNEKISSIIKTAKVFFTKISIVFIIYTVFLAIVYPICTNSSFSFNYIFILVLIMSIGLLIQYTFSITYKTLLNADKKVYVVSITQSITLLLNMIFCFMAVHIYPNIHILKLFSGVVFIIQPIIYNYIIKTKYNIDPKAKIDNELLKDRWSGFAINIAAFIHFNTDIVILNLFTTLKIVSIYSVYNLVISGLRQIITAITSSIYPTIGHIYVKGVKKEILKAFELYEFITFFVIFTLFSVAFLLITPFVEVYTNNITDLNYSMPLLGSLMVISEMIYLIKAPHINIAYSANKFKEMKWPSIFEAMLNIIVSIVLVNKFGIIGVAIGTLIAMVLRTIYQVIFLKKILFNRNVWLFVKKVLIFSIGFIAIVLIGKIVIPLDNPTIITWLTHGSIYSIISLALFSLISLVFYREDVKEILQRVLKKKIKDV